VACAAWWSQGGLGGLPPVNLRVNQHDAGSTSGTNNFVNDETFPTQSIGSAPISVTDLADYQSIELRYMCSTSMWLLRGHTPEHTARQPPLIVSRMDGSAGPSVS
jgi:hypothetical protein